MLYDFSPYQAFLGICFEGFPRPLLATDVIFGQYISLGEQKSVHEAFS